MNQVTVSIPEKLDDKIMDSARERGISRSEKIRNDLMNMYFEDQ